MSRSIREMQFFPRHQPQTLQIAVALLYWNAFLGFLIGLLDRGQGVSGLLLVLLVAEVAGGFGVANDRKWGYVVALLAAFLPFVLVIGFGFVAGGILNLIFEIALVILLLHPMSRSYYKIWFR